MGISIKFGNTVKEDLLIIKPLRLARKSFRDSKQHQSVGDAG